MANANRPQGFVPVKHLDGSPYNDQANMYLLDSGDATVVGIGDVVITAGGAGAAGSKVHGVVTEGMPTITRSVNGAIGASTVGVVVGFVPDPTNLNVKHRLASTSRVALVCDDPDVIFEIQEDAVTTPIAAASIGLNCAYALGATSATTGLSGMMLDSDTVAVTATLPVRILRLVNRPDNVLSTGATSYARYEVKFVTHYYSTALAIA